MKQILIMTAVLSVIAMSAVAQNKNPFIPEIHGTIRAKYEYEPQIDKGRGNNKDARRIRATATKGCVKIHLRSDESAVYH